MTITLTAEEAVVAQKIMRAVDSLPVGVDEFAGLTDVECGYDPETEDELDNCPLWSLREKLVMSE